MQVPLASQQEYHWDFIPAFLPLQVFCYPSRSVIIWTLTDHLTDAANQLA